MKRWTVWSAAIAALAIIVAVLAVTNGSAVRPHKARSSGADAGAAIELSASATKSHESSIAIAMGHLGSPSNTFWELFLRPTNGTSWTLHTPPGVASNGGLVVTAPPTGPLTVGFITSADLKFSPVAQSSDGGRIWSPGELPLPLTKSPDALAVGPNGDVLALVGGAGQSVLETSGSGQISAWRSLISMKALSVDASACGVRSVTAIAFTLTSQPLVGLDCDHGGHIGILTAGTSSSVPYSGWHTIGPPLDAGNDGDSVLRLESTATGVVGLAQTRSPTASSVVAFWGPGATGEWPRPIAFPIPLGWSVQATATGGGSGQGLAVLLGSGTKRRVEAIAGPGTSWATLPPAPRGAGGVADVGTEIDTFVVTGSRLTVWAKTMATAGWRRTAVINVPVPYGSSS